MTGLVYVLPPRVAPATDVPASAGGTEPAVLATLLTALLDGVRAPARPRGLAAARVAAALGEGLADLAALARPRVTLRLSADPEPWELGLERSGRDVLATVFRAGASPEVAVYERRIDGESLAVATLDALAVFAADPAASDLSGELDFDLDDADPTLPLAALAAKERLARALPFGDAPAPEGALVSIDPAGAIPIVLAADVVMRAVPSTGTSVLRADLFSLLFRGRVRLAVGEQEREIPDVFVFPFVERLVSIGLDALDSWSRERAFHRRHEAGGAVCGVRLSPRGAASLTLGSAARRTSRSEDARAHTWTFPAVDVAALAQAIVAFSRALTRSIVRRDRAQASNLRVVELKAATRELADRLRESTRVDAKINAAPDSYRAFAASLREGRQGGETFASGRLRFDPRWVATVPSIDLRATFLCGESLVVGASREVSCIDRTTGAILWRRPVPRAVSLLTSAGLCRFEPDGSLHLFDLATGETLWSTRLAPRVGGVASGGVVGAAGLPRTLLVSEGARHVAAVDLDSGEVRWRHPVRRGGAVRVRRAGRLALVTSGEPALTALDVVTGEVVWRHCDRLRFASPVAVDPDALFALAGDGAFLARGGTRLHHVDPWSGAARWSAELPPHLAPVGAPLVAPETVLVATHGRRGTGLLAFDRATGELRFERTPCAGAASCLVVDDLVIQNSEAGELVAVGASDGETRWRHVFGDGEGDRPRRLEPILRSGALFVPQNEVHIVRPRDGAVLGKLPCDLVPDLLRVDERCSVYVVEESGHVAAFGAAPRLSIVR